MRIAVAQVFGPLCRSKAKANDIRGILGAGAQAALLVAAQVGRAKRLAHAVPDEQSADSLGGMHFMAGYRESIHVLPLFQVNGDAQPCLHGVHMHRTAAVFGLDGCGKSGNILQSAGFIIDRHAADQNGIFIHLGSQFGNIQVTVCFRQDFHHLKAAVFQCTDGPLHAGVLKTGNHNFAAPVFACHGKALHGKVVALAAAGGKIQILGLAAQGAGNLPAGRGQGFMGFYRRFVQAGGVRPIL